MLMLDKVKKELKNSDLAKKTQERYINHLENFIINMKGKPLNYNQIKKHIQKLDFSNTYINLKITTIKYLLENILDNPTLAQKIIKLRPKKNNGYKGTYLNPREVEEVLANSTTEKYKLAFRLMYEGCLTLQELTNLRIENIKKSKIEIDNRINKPRLSKITINLLNNYIQEEGLNHIGFLFPAVRGSNDTISERTIQNHFKTSYKNSKIKKGKTTIKDLRASKIIDLLNEGKTINEVKKISNVQNRQTLSRYKAC